MANHDDADLWNFVTMKERPQGLTLKTLLDHEFRILVLEGVIDVLSSRIPIAGPAVLPEDLRRIREAAIRTMQRKYPGLQIKAESL